MAKGAVKRIRRRAKRKPYTFNVNAVNNRKKHRKHRSTMAAPQVEEAWDAKATTKENLRQMGLAYDPNDVLPVPSTKAALRDPRPHPSTASDPLPQSLKKKSKKKLKPEVVEALEKEANTKLPSMPRVSNPEVLYAVRLIERHGDDYTAMAKDPSNHYQETPKQIRQKIQFFKKTHQYQAYLTAKQTVTQKSS